MVRKLTAFTGLALSLSIAACGGTGAPEPGERQDPPGVNGEANEPEGERGAISTPVAADRNPLEHFERENLKESYDAFLQRRVGRGATEYPWDKYWLAIAAAQGMRQISIGQGSVVQEGDVLSFAGGSLGNWTLLGDGNISGRVRDILVHPTTPSIMVAAGDSGGIWRSTDSGANWALVGSDLPLLYMEDLAIDPNTPNTMYAASGNLIFNVKGGGIYKSTDAGATWTSLSSTVPSPTNTNFDVVAHIAVSKNNSQRIYAATSAGIMRSTNGGTSWTAVFPGHSCGDITIRTDVTATDYVMAGCGYGSDAQLLVNSDAAGTGTWVNRWSNTDAWHIRLAIAPSQQATAYASVQSVSTSGTLAILRTTDGGTSWSTQSTSGLLDYCSPSGSFGSGGQIFNTISVDPADPQRVWVGGTLLWRSDDGAVTWGRVNNQFTNVNPAFYIHVDHSAVVFHPQYNGTTNQTVFVGNDGGIYKSTNARAATDTKGLCRDDASYAGQVTWSSLDHSLANNQFYFGDVASDGSSYLGGTQDDHTMWGWNSKGVNGWENRWFNGDGGFVAIDRKNSKIEFTFGSGKIVKTTDEGLTWNDVAGFNINGPGYPGEIAVDASTPMIADPMSCGGTSCNRWWAGGLKMWRSPDGVSFTQASTQIPLSGNRITAIGVAETNPNRVFAGTDAGVIAVTNVATNATSTTAWTQTTPHVGTVSSFAFHPYNHDIAYASYTGYNSGSNVGHVFKTTNGGANWTLSDGSGSTGLPDAPVHSLAVNSYNPSRVYAGTEIGVFVSDDAGVTWAAETGLGHVIVTRLLFIKATSELFAFTYGRGLNKVFDPNTNPSSYVEVTPAASAVTASGNDGNVPGNTVDNNLTTRWANAGDGQWIQYDLGTNRAVGYVSMAFYQGDQRKYKFDLQVSTNGTSFTTVRSGTSSGTTTAQEIYDFPDVTARYVRYLGHGYVSNTGTTGTPNSLFEVDIFAAPASGSAPPAPTGVAVTAGNAQAMLSWSASSGATGYKVKRATVSGGPYTTVGTPTTTTFVDTGATNGTTFFYVVSATNASGESANSAQVSAAPNASTCKTATGGASGAGAWVNTPFPSQAGTFTAEYDGTPSAVLDSSITMSKGAQTAFTGMATLTRFNTSGNIDARNGGAFAANVTLPYAGASAYHFRLAVNVAAHTYSIFVTPPGGAEQTIGTNFAFRTEQNTVTSLDNWGVNVNKAGTTITDKVCNFWVHP